MSNDPKLVLYQLVGAPVSYIGELVSYDTEKGVLVMTKVLQRSIMRSRQNPEDMEYAIQPVDAAVRESHITFNTNTLPGFVVEGLDGETTDMYKSKVVSLYSNLTLL